MATASTVPALPDPTRYITDTNDGGIAHFNETHGETVAVHRDLGGALLRLAYAVPPPPALLDGKTDFNAYKTLLGDPDTPLVPKGNVAAVWFIDTPPGAASPSHRTTSLDIVVQLNGQMELTLDEGHARQVRPGDVTVQRSTRHTWRNPSSTEWSRMMGVMIECQPNTVNGEPLGTFFSGLPNASH